MNTRIIFAIVLCLTISKTLAMTISIGNLLAKVSKVPLAYSITSDPRVDCSDSDFEAFLNNFAEAEIERLLISGKYTYPRAIAHVGKQIDKLCYLRVLRSLMPLQYHITIPMYDVAFGHGSDVSSIEQLALIVSLAFQRKQTRDTLQDVLLKLGPTLTREVCFETQPRRKYKEHLSNLAERLETNGTTFLDGPLEGTASIEGENPVLTIWQTRSSVKK